MDFQTYDSLQPSDFGELKQHFLILTVSCIVHQLVKLLQAFLKTRFMVGIVKEI